VVLKLVFHIRSKCHCTSRSEEIRIKWRCYNPGPDNKLQMTPYGSLFLQKVFFILLICQNHYYLSLLKNEEFVLTTSIAFGNIAICTIFHAAVIDFVSSLAGLICVQRYTDLYFNELYISNSF